MPSLLEAIEFKYGETGSCGCCSLTPDTPPPSPDATSGIPILAIYVPKKNPRNCIPSLLVLNDCDIDKAGDETLLASKCQGVEELDLAQNKLTRWNEIFDILQHMPRVKFVNLSFNRLEETLEKAKRPYPYLKNLVLNGCRIDWPSVRRILRQLPSLEELHLSLNEYSSVELNSSDTCLEAKENTSTSSNKPEETGYSPVKKLHFTGNPIKEWSEVMKIGQAFPRLEALVLAQCPIASLDVTNNTSSANQDQSQGENVSYNRSESESEGSESGIATPHNHFRFLQFLNLNNTSLSTWDEIDRLGRFPALKCLRIQGCPLFEKKKEVISRVRTKRSTNISSLNLKEPRERYKKRIIPEYTEHERRQLLISRLPNVTTLNGGGQITIEEREDAERAFIRYYMHKPEADRPDRYSDLVGIHGKLNPLVNVDLSPEKRVKVTFTFGDLIEVRSMLVYQTVQELKQRLEPILNIPPSKMRLFYLDQELKGVHGPEELKFPSKQLYSYNIRNGDEILVDTKF